MECPKCKRHMTNTTPTKGYCMKCDILVHLPSRVAYTGDPKEDKFIGSPAVWMGQKKNGLEATLSPDALVMTWKEGKSYGQKRIPYADITTIQMGKRRETEFISAEAAAIGAALGGLATAGIGLAASYFTHLETLQLSTKGGNYEIFVAQATDWASRLYQNLRPTNFCRHCGSRIPRDSKFCEVCGTRLS